MRGVWLLVCFAFGCALDEGVKSSCITSDDCLVGRVCVDGACANVADVDDTPSSCPEVACASPATCERGLCAEEVQVDPECDPYSIDGDGCPSDAVCDDDAGAPRCLRYPPCGEGGACPVGSYGSACSGGDIPGKASMCLPRVCRESAHCPANWTCVFPFGALGGCTDGTSGMPCANDGDCDSNDCNTFFAACN